MTGAGLEGGRSLKIPQSVLVVIYTVQGAVLLLERADRAGFWQSVTGSKDTPDEPFAHTAAREVEEETGLRMGDNGLAPTALEDWNLTNVYEIYAHWRHRYPPGVTTNEERVFGLRLPDTVPVRLAPREHTRHQWLGIQDAAERCFSPSNAEAILTLPGRL